MVLYEDLQEQLFYKIVDQLIQSERINGIIQGKHDGMIFIPKLFNEARINWINSFFNQNQYIGNFLKKYTYLLDISNRL